MNDYRVDSVERVFIILDKKGTGVVPVEQLKKQYVAKRHPEVVSGNKSEEQMLMEFIETFDLHHSIFNKQRNQKVTMDEFMSYYQHISSFVPSDNEFNVMINNSWDLYGEGGSGLQSQQLQQLGKQDTDSFYKHSASSNNAKYGSSAF